MFSLSRLIACLVTLLILGLYACPSAIAFTWTLRFAPLDYTPSTADAFAPSTSVPVTPQFFRVLVTRKQVIVGAEKPYIRDIKPAPPLHFKPLPRPASESVANARAPRPAHHLRGPEARLLRHPQTVVGKADQ